MMNGGNKLRLPPSGRIVRIHLQLENRHSSLINHSLTLIPRQLMSASEYNVQFVPPVIIVSDMHGRQSKVPVPSVIITF